MRVKMVWFLREFYFGKLSSVFPLVPAAALTPLMCLVKSSSITASCKQQHH